MRTSWRWCWVLAAMALAASPARADEPTPQQIEFFEKQVRPVLVARCHDCHAGETAESKFRADSRAALLKGGLRGPAIVPGDPDKSLMILAVNHADQLHMPPKSKIPQKEIAALTEWVKQGAFWPNEAPVAAPADKPADKAPLEPTFTDKQKRHWSFQRPTEPQLPGVQKNAWVQSPIDAFVLARLEQAGLQPAPPADRRTLIRRATFDLAGLPPAQTEIDDFLADATPDAFAKVVDRLLASPHYGERWGRHWLDLARYGDSNGLDENLSYGNAFRYRDYVIAALNADKPYDRFLVEQLAGDLLPDDDATPLAERLVATGFLVIGAKMLAEDDPVKMQMDIIDEQIDTLGKAALGMTLGCARCHDHKFDPISTADYYGLAGIFKSTKTMEHFSVVARWQERAVADPEQIREYTAARSLLKSVQAELEKMRGSEIDTVLDDARRRTGDYVLAAAQQIRHERELARLSPLGDQPNVEKTPGAILIEAEHFARGNAQRDSANYGRGIGVILNAGTIPNTVEYDVAVPAAGLYRLELRYAAAEARPCRLFLNGRILKNDLASKTTGSWFPDGQRWFVEGLLALPAGNSVLKIERPDVFPHIDKLLLLPHQSSSPGVNSPASFSATESSRQLKPEFVAQWAGYLRDLRPDSGSVFAVWSEIASSDSMTSLSATVRESLAVAEPSIPAAELARRYQDRCIRVLDASQGAQPRTEAGTDTRGTDKPAQQSNGVDDGLRQVLFDPRGPFAVPETIDAYFPAAAQDRLKLLRADIKLKEAAVPKLPEAMSVYNDVPQNVRIHYRGNHVTQGAEIRRRFPKIMTGDNPPVIAESSSGRLELARWLTSDAHPLTARVFVNRVWRGHFGQALVRTADNFGLLGEPPTHPELLDYLAVRFMKDGWSIKGLHRAILLSSAYQMSTAWNEKAAAVDPENRLLWRMNRRRLEVEAIRDALLAATGGLETQMGGSLLTTPNRLYVTSTASVNPDVYKPARRSVYLPVVRSALYDVFQAFDFPDPTTSNGERGNTTVAPQALFMMNAELTSVATRRWARALLDDGQKSDVDRVRAIFADAYGRPPREDETALAVQFVESYANSIAAEITDPKERQTRAWQALCRAILSANEFLYVE